MVGRSHIGGDASCARNMPMGKRHRGGAVGERKAGRYVNRYEERRWVVGTGAHLPVDDSPRSVTGAATAIHPGSRAGCGAARCVDPHSINPRHGSTGRGTWLRAGWSVSEKFSYHQNIPTSKAGARAEGFPTDKPLRPAQLDRFSNQKKRRIGGRKIFLAGRFSKRQKGGSHSHSSRNQTGKREC